MSQPPPDLFPQRPVRSEFGRTGLARSGFGRRRFLWPPSYRARRVITISIVAIILVLVLRAVFDGSSLMAPGSVATIKAEGAWKQRPEQPGGLDIPNQKVQVYQELDNKTATTPAAEHLMPPPEAPQASATSAPPPPAVPAAAPQIESLTPPKLEIDSIPTTVIESPPAPAIAPAPVSTQAPAPVAAPTPAPVTAQAPTPAPVSSVSAAPAAAKPPAKAKPPLTIAQVLKDVQTAPKTDRIVQLASVPDEATARDMADKLQTRYASVLGSAQLRVVRANVAGKGIYYRIQSQPIAGGDAGKICSAIKQMKAGCILVRP